VWTGGTACATEQLQQVSHLSPIPRVLYSLVINDWTYYCSMLSVWNDVHMTLRGQCSFQAGPQGYNLFTGVCLSSTEYSSVLEFEASTFCRVIEFVGLSKPELYNLHRLKHLTWMYNESRTFPWH
jgi:hypothetical protein